MSDIDDLLPKAIPPTVIPDTRGGMNNIFIQKMKQTLDLGMGKRRTLTDQEEADLARAQELRDAASSLRYAAWELEQQADEIAPDNLYPDSVWGKNLDRTELPNAEGKRWREPRLT